MNSGLSRSKAISLGLVLVACLALAGWGLLRIGAKETRLGDTFEAVVVLADAGELEPGAVVRIRGLDAGQVVAIEAPAEDPDHVHVRLKLAKSQRDRVFADARAQVATKGLLGASTLNILPGKTAAGVWDGSPIPGEPSIDLQTVAAKLSKIADQADALFGDVREGKGTVGKLLKDDDLYKELKGLSKEARELLANGKTAIGSVQEELDGVKEFVRNGNEAIVAIKQDADAVKGLPIIRSYVEDPVGLLVRPTAERQREVFQDTDLFETGRAVLTPTGKAKLSSVVRWLNENKGSNTEVVVAAFADPKNRELTSSGARKLTEKQAEAVAEFLKENNVARLSWLSSRKVAPLGFGQGASPVVEKEALPAGRVEIVLFTQR